METGLVIPGKDKTMTFTDVDAYLDFFENVLVRHSKSPYQIKLAERYSVYVRASSNPAAVPLLIPELRYEGRAVKHKYRLDFCVVDPVTMQKTGFELSPWSTHGELTGTKGKTQKEINAEASANFEALDCWSGPRQQWPSWTQPSQKLARVGNDRPGRCASTYRVPPSPGISNRLWASSKNASPT